MLIDKIPKIIGLLVILTFTSCEKENNIPAYIMIEDIKLSNNATHNITDAWVYINDNLQGVYELPANFPVLEQGQQKLRIKAGIKDNGIAGTRVPYPFYSSYILEEQEFNPEGIISVDPEVSYLESTNFFLEDFEGIGLDLEMSLTSDTSIIEINENNNKYAAGLLVDSLINFEVISDELTNLPQAGAPVYLELDYQCNTRFLAGVYINYSQSVIQKDLLWINNQRNNVINLNVKRKLYSSCAKDCIVCVSGIDL